MSFTQFGLRDELLKAAKGKGYSKATPVQAAAIPAILAGRDIMARAQTGTGKTDAFVLPMVDILSRRRGNIRQPRALVLAPTRELALQVGECIKSYARRVSIRCTVVYGGVRVQPQIERLKRGVDVLVATPGRLLDLADQRHLNLSMLEFLVFDEADRMLDMGFIAEISAILDMVPDQRQTMLFSATYTKQIRGLAGRMLHKPANIEITPAQTAAESVEQRVYMVERANKFALLVHLLVKGRWPRTLVFARTKHGANKLTEKLAAKGISVAALHGNKSQSFRTRTLAEFRRGDVRTLVATDVAARGLDITSLPCVINYDMPTIAEDYVHRIGRTGRAGMSGLAISLVCPDENIHLQAIEQLLQTKIPLATIAGYTEDNDVPDYVLLRPNNPASEKKADRAIKALVGESNFFKKQMQSRNGKKGAGKAFNPKNKSKPGRKKAKPSKNTRIKSRSLWR